MVMLVDDWRATFAFLIFTNTPSAARNAQFCTATVHILHISATQRKCSHIELSRFVSCVNDTKAVDLRFELLTNAP